MHKHTHIPLNLVCLIAGNKKIDQTSVIDLRENQSIKCICEKVLVGLVSKVLVQMKKFVFSVNQKLH